MKMIAAIVCSALALTMTSAALATGIPPEHTWRSAVTFHGKTWVNRVTDTSQRLSIPMPKTEWGCDVLPVGMNTDGSETMLLQCSLQGAHAAQTDLTCSQTESGKTVMLSLFFTDDHLNEDHVSVSVQCMLPKAGDK